jgi:hypothetical protein
VNFAPSIFALLLKDGPQYSFESAGASDIDASRRLYHLIRAFRSAMRSSAMGSYCFRKSVSGI